jgi:hypothetical protein
MSASGKLVDGNKTYCETWLKEQLYERKKEFTSKTTEKGNIVEDNSIDFIGEMLELGIVFKNEKHFEDEYMTGTPDIILPDLIIDAKNSWDCFTFPLFEKELPTKDYYWQAQGYMNLTGIDKYKVIYVISDTPENLIEKEVYFWCRNNGYNELDLDVLEQFKKKMTYSEIPNNLKIKVFDIEKNIEDIQKIKDKVLLCREYIDELKKILI